MNCTERRKTSNTLTQIVSWWETTMFDIWDKIDYLKLVLLKSIMEGRTNAKVITGVNGGVWQSNVSIFSW
jgi:hypothetical protein